MPGVPDAHPPDRSRRSKKQALRGRILALREDFPEPLHREASQLLVERIAALPSFRAAGTVLLTLPFRSEWDTTKLVSGALAECKVVAIPRVDHVARMLVLHRVLDLASDVVPGWQGIPEPRPDTPVVPASAIDWVLVPGVAFDPAGRRLGYGGGFYDRLLPLFREGVPRIAGALELQIVDDVPAGPHDQRIDAVITPTRTFGV